MAAGDFAPLPNAVWRPCRTAVEGLLRSYDIIRSAEHTHVRFPGAGSFFSLGQQGHVELRNLRQSGPCLMGQVRLHSESGVLCRADPLRVPQPSGVGDLEGIQVDGQSENSRPPSEASDCRNEA